MNELKKTTEVELKNKVKVFCKKCKISPSKIDQGTVENPFPIGTRALYQLACGKSISWDMIEKLIKFFKEEQKG